MLAKVRRKPRLPQRGEIIEPTPEQVAKAGEWYTRTPDGYSRVLQSTLERMAARRQLNADPDINRVLAEAGDRWRADWHRSGLGGSMAVSMERGFGGTGDPAWSIPSTVHAASARAAWREARRAMTPDERTVVGAIVLDEASIIAAGLMVTGGMASGRKCRGVATTLLRDGLRSLARHYGLDR